MKVWQTSTKRLRKWPLRPESQWTKTLKCNNSTRKGTTFNQTYEVSKNSLSLKKWTKQNWSIPWEPKRTGSTLKSNLDLKSPSWGLSIATCRCHVLNKEWESATSVHKHTIFVLSHDYFGMYNIYQQSQQSKHIQRVSLQEQFSNSTSLTIN